MELSVGQKVAYPNQGVCLVEQIERKKIGGKSMKFYALRVLSDDSTIFVPLINAETVGIRPIITSYQYRHLINKLSADFETISDDWKERSREFNYKLQSGDVFEAADVLKKLTFLSREKKLSFREQSFLEKARFLVVSEITSAGLSKENRIETKIDKLIENACRKHFIVQPRVMVASH
ncbi:MAG: CarD family transcriptional regulator [Pyrinomonadaceae bacterium]